MLKHVCIAFAWLPAMAAIDKQLGVPAEDEHGLLWVYWMFQNAQELIFSTPGIELSGAEKAIGYWTLFSAIALSTTLLICAYKLCAHRSWKVLIAGALLLPAVCVLCLWALGGFLGAESNAQALYFWLHEGAITALGTFGLSPKNADALVFLYFGMSIVGSMYMFILPKIHKLRY